MQLTHLLGMTSFTLSVRIDELAQSSGLGPTSVADDVIRPDFQQTHRKAIRVGSQQFTAS
jgi:hypothetical protein